MSSGYWFLFFFTDCLCNLGSKYNGRICPGFINTNSKSSKQSYPQLFCNIPLKNIVYNLVIADSYQIIELKTSSDQWKLFKGDDVDFYKKRFYFCNRLFIYFTIIKTFYPFWILIFLIYRQGFKMFIFSTTVFFAEGRYRWRFVS